MTVYSSVTSEALEDIAFNFAKTLKCPTCVLLFGDLGVGKSTFARALIQALTTKDIIVPSPTFTILQSYETTAGPLTHFDLYRIEELEELFELGMEEYIEHHICLIEWPERLGPITPPHYIEVRIKEISESLRQIEVINK